MDYKKFIESGVKYLATLYGKEGAEWQAKTSDIPKEIGTCKLFIDEIDTDLRLPSEKDLKNLLGEGFLPICLINYMGLIGKRGYAGHMVVVTGYDRKGFYIHDPGLPPSENRFVNYKVFERAWASPDEKTKNIMAFRYNH